MKYFKEGLKAEGHTPIYKMHKYFARRPQNVFRSLVEHYSNESDIVLDVFCGGGVTLFEGLAANRRVVGYDLNPLATFISEAQITQCGVDDYLYATNDILNQFKLFVEPFYMAKGARELRWCERAYVVICPFCGEETLLSNENKASDRAGFYNCEECHKVFKAIDGKRVGNIIVSVTTTKVGKKEQITKKPSKSDLELDSEVTYNFEKIIAKHNLWYPKVDIPIEWDRQQEDCLHRKGIYRFSDMFTPRNLISMAYLLKIIQEKKKSVSPEVYKLLLLTFSATLRYTCNLTISTKSWMGGRPVAWAKHAFWISNQFVEVNPIEYLEKRIAAVVSGLKHQSKALKGKKKKAYSFADLANKQGDFLIVNSSSDKLKIPNESVDLVLTDPPYGNNVQYSELSSFWNVWISDELGFEIENTINSTAEIVMTRKTKQRSKDSEHYYGGLLAVFRECYRVLKPGRPLVFTFNNKEAEVWYSLIKAAHEAGFALEPEGVVYQEGIENYESTAHTRYEGSLHGDFLYTFIKPLSPRLSRAGKLKNRKSVALVVTNALKKQLKDFGSTTVSELYVEVFRKFVPIFYTYALSDMKISDFDAVVPSSQIVDILKKHCNYDGVRKVWVEK